MVTGSLIWKSTKPQRPPNVNNKKKLDKDIYLSNGTSGYIIGFPKVTYGKDWKEERDYLWPIPADQRVLTQGILTQNPGWEDGLSY